MANALLLLIPSLFLTLINGGLVAAAAAEVKGMFVFGSSLVDNGNNNFIVNSRARADYLPYGVDSPFGASGRFSNARNPVDALGELLKLDRPIPPFADPRTKGKRILHGVNFASGGSGILDQTGSITGGVMSLNQQIKNFESTTLPDLRAQIRRNQTLSAHLSDTLFIVGTGGNDYMLNYFLPSTSTKKPSLKVFTSILISRLTNQLEKLYNLGARKFAFFSIQPIGCTPVVRKTLQAANGSCIEAMNQAALLFNSQLRSMVHNAKTWMPNSNMVYINSYKIIMDIIDNPIPNGFSDASAACCELFSREGGGDGVLCRRGGRVCSNRAAHVFFDGLHPTDAVNARIAHKGYASSMESEVYPINVKKLARL